jgi:Ca2+:H+ antiporter
VTKEATGEALGMSSAFLGMVVLAVVGGAAESFSAIAMARKDRMDMSLGIAMGSCVQIVLFVTPMLVLGSSWIGPRPLLITFGQGTILAVLMAVLMGAFVASDGKSNWFKGVQLLVVYRIMASLLYYLPDLE